MPSPYARQMGDSITRLVTLFDGRMPDHEVQQCLYDIASDSARWAEAHQYHSSVRRRLLATSDPFLQGQYYFVESCLETLYNETDALDPFDSVSPFWVVPNALRLAEKLEIPIDHVLNAVYGDT